MKTSESILKITPAFLEAQKKIESVIKDQTNPYFKSKYADLSGVIEACKDKLNAQNIAVLQPIDGMTVETVLVHTSGEWFSSSTPIVCKEANNPQALGSAITYAKRYGLQSMVLLPAEDDDANKASTPVVNAYPRATSQATGQTDAWKSKPASLKQQEAMMKISEGTGKKLGFNDVKDWTAGMASDYIVKCGSGGYNAKKKVDAETENQDEVAPF
mgnify:FL=1